ncbi:hypothetical protein [Bacillus xiapuensis]|uniref:Uncharacterized protein n=1 Tax=Bacillus xiapuensis TaxID=2014075 RepID=A0ABU6NC33_9BACI|nr:hypothetical protein [Bacillus xiapuensis]
MKKSERKSVKIVSNEAVVGKPYLDIDRVILEGKSGHSYNDANKRK